MREISTKFTPLPEQHKPLLLNQHLEFVMIVVIYENKKDGFRLVTLI